jgi:uncharacterized protein (DUF427 family)
MLSIESQDMLYPTDTHFYHKAKGESQYSQVNLLQECNNLKHTFVNLDCDRSL